MKRKALVLALLVICTSLIATGTYAFFSAQDTAHNVITSGNVGIELVEKTVDDSGAVVDFPTNGISGVLPGSSVSKIVSVTNNGVGEAWIRIKVVPSIVGANKTELPIELTVNGSVIPIMTFAVDESKWLIGADGCYYYKSSVPAGESTDILFDTVKFAKEMNNDYQKAQAILTVTAQAVQTANNPIPDGGDVSGVKGWPSWPID